MEIHGQDAYAKMMEVCGYGSNYSWLLDNIEIVAPVIEQLRGEKVLYRHRSEQLMHGVLLGITTKVQKMEVGVNVYVNYTEYIVKIKENYKRRRLSLKVTKLWHPAIHAVYLMNK